MSVDPLQSPPKKGMGPVGWIAIGCGVILVFGFIAAGSCMYYAKTKLEAFKKNPAKTAAEMVVRFNPDLEMVSEDEKAGTMTVKNKKTGETVTMNFDDIKEGKLKITTDKGTTTVDTSGGAAGGTLKVTDEKGQTATFSSGSGAPKGMPSWLPVYPGASTQGSYSTDTADGHAGGFTLSTKDSVEQVADYYEKQLKAAGLTVSKNMMSTDNKTSGGSISGASADKKQEAAIFVTAVDGGAQATITFAEKK
jgi:hypothetical protein